MNVRLIALALTVLALGGCQPVGEPSPPQPDYSAPASDSVVPSDVAADLAEAAVREYFAVSAAIAAAGGEDTSAIDGVVSAAWRNEELAGFAAIREVGVTPEGAPSLFKLEVAAMAGVAAVGEAIVHVCTSTDGFAVIDNDGIALPVEPEVHHLTVFVVAQSERFVVDGVDVIEDTSWCAE
jgi:hypothetical protein